MRWFLAFASGAVLFLSLPASAPGAIVTDGKLEPDYGAALSTQTTQTTLDNNPALGQANYSGGSELDAAYATISDGVLHLFLAGNLVLAWNLEGVTVWLPVQIFLDTGPGGQNQLLPNNPSFNAGYDLHQLAGLTFDPGFAPDYWLGFGGNVSSWPNTQAYFAELPTPGGGAGVYLGSSTAGGTGTLSGGSNPWGFEATIDESNVVGVTQGCGAASGAGVTTGIEWAIPLAALNHPDGCIEICVFDSDYGTSGYGVRNQVLGPVPPGFCDLGPASGVNFGSIPGSQFFTVCPAPVPALSSSWGGIKARYR